MPIPMLGKTDVKNCNIHVVFSLCLNSILSSHKLTLDEQQTCYKLNLYCIFKKYIFAVIIYYIIKLQNVLCI